MSKYFDNEGRELTAQEIADLESLVRRAYLRLPATPEQRKEAMVVHAASTYDGGL